jgi:hypothetical protein
MNINLDILNNVTYEHAKFYYEIICTVVHKNNKIW